MIQLGDERYWLYVAVDPETNELLLAAFEPTGTEFSRTAFLRTSGENDIDDAVVLVDGARPLKDACRRYDIGFRDEKYETRNNSKNIILEVK